MDMEGVLGKVTAFQRVSKVDSRAASRVGHRRAHGDGGSTYLCPGGLLDGPKAYAGVSTPRAAITNKSSHDALAAGPRRDESRRDRSDVQPARRLAAVLEASGQSDTDFELIVADDGSPPNRSVDEVSLPEHLSRCCMWQVDEDFRLAAIAIGPRCRMRLHRVTDGDCVPRVPRAPASPAAEPGCSSRNGPPSRSADTKVVEQRLHSSGGTG